MLGFKAIESDISVYANNKSVEFYVNDKLMGHVEAAKTSYVNKRLSDKFYFTNLSGKSTPVSVGETDFDKNKNAKEIYYIIKCECKYGDE